MTKLKIIKDWFKKIFSMKITATYLVKEGNGGYRPMTEQEKAFFNVQLNMLNKMVEEIKKL